MVLLSVLLVSTWIHVRRGHRNSGQRPSRSAVYLPSRGRGPLSRGTALATVTTSPISQESVFYFPFLSFWRNKLYSFQGYGSLFCCIAEYASRKAGVHSALP